MAKRNIRKGDKVVVLAGKDKGREGEVLRVLPSEARVVVAGVGMIKRHTRPGQGGTGGIVAREAPIHISNVALMDPETGKATRVRRARDRDGVPYRVSARSGKRIES